MPRKRKSRVILLDAVIVALILIVYVVGYFNLRRIEVDPGGDYMAITLGEQIYMLLPLSSAMEKSLSESYERHRTYKEKEPDILSPHLNNRTYGLNGAVEMRLPTKYRFFFPAIKAEQTYWLICSAIVR
jgi:hypothetical protein